MLACIDFWSQSPVSKPRVDVVNVKFTSTAFLIIFQQSVSTSVLILSASCARRTTATAAACSPPQSVGEDPRGSAPSSSPISQVCLCSDLGRFAPSCANGLCLAKHLFTLRDCDYNGSHSHISTNYINNVHLAGSIVTSKLWSIDHVWQISISPLENLINHANNNLCCIVLCVLRHYWFLQRGRGHGNKELHARLTQLKD